MTKKQSPKSVVSIKIGSSVCGPTKRMLRDIRETAIQCNAIRTMGEAWVMDTVERSLQVRIAKLTGMDRVRERERIILTTPLSKLVALKYLYKPEMVDAFPAVSSALVSACCRDVVQRLTAKMPWFFDRPKPRAKKVWQGILLGEAQRDVWRSLRIPIKNGVCKLTCAGPGRPYVLDFPLFAKASYRKQLRARCRLDVREHGKRSVIISVVRLPGMFRDSELIFDTDCDHWTLQLVHACTQRELVHSENIAELVLASPLKQDYPFVLLRDGQRPWWIGRGGKFVRYQEDYLWRKRKVMGLRYRESQRATEDGHGRKEVHRKLRHAVRAVQDRHKQFVHDLIIDVVRYCKRFGIGSLIYWEPSMPLRNGTWFSRLGVSFNWSTFTPRLVQRLQSEGILVEVKTERLQRHCERWGVDNKAIFARVEKRLGDTEVANIVYVYGEGKPSRHAAPLATGDAQRSEQSDYKDGAAADEE